MKQGVVGLSMVVVLALVAEAAVTKLTTQDLKNLEAPANVELLHSMAQLPREVVDACAAAVPGHGFRLADPGQPFQVTDAISPEERDLPGRRLIWAARLPRYYVVHYEAGGIAHTYHVLVLAADEPSKSYKVIWSAMGNRIEDYDAFRAALKDGKLDDRDPVRSAR